MMTNSFDHNGNPEIIDIPKIMGETKTREVNVNQDMSQDISELAQALSKAQSTIEHANTDKVNPFYKSKYADLANVWDACRKALTANNLAVTQTTDISDDDVIVVTTLIHSSGQWMRGKLKMKPVKKDPQGIGSCITYARRYALAAIVGVATEDDDGNSASTKNELKTVNEAQISDLQLLIEETGTDLARFCDAYQIPSLSDLPLNRYNHAKTALAKKRSK